MKPADDTKDDVDDNGGQLSCVGPQARLFFSSEMPAIERAKALCAGCAGRSSCLAGALDRREPWGVWGGELFEEGRIIARRRPRGRPPKPRPTAPTPRRPARHRPGRRDFDAE